MKQKRENYYYLLAIMDEANKKQMFYLRWTGASVYLLFFAIETHTTVVRYQS